MVEVKERTYGGETGAERAARRRALLVEAAFASIAEDGWAQLRIERVCRRADLNKRYFYESFSDLDALIVAVIDGLANETVDVTVAAMDTTAPEPEFIRAGIAALVKHVTDDPRRARVLFGETSSEAAAEHRTLATRRLVAEVSAIGRAVHDLEDEPLVDLTSAVLIGGTSQAVLDWIEGRLHDDIEAFIDDLAALWLHVAEGAAAEQHQRSES